MPRPWLLLLLSAALADAQVSERGWWQGKSIQFQAQDGWALVEGDILLAPLSEVEWDPPVRPKANLSRRDALILSEERFRWRDGLMPYRLAADLPNTARVEEAMRLWSEATPIRFVELTDEQNFVTFRRSTGCSATLGMRGGEQFVNLADGCSTSNTVHEIGHSLGLFHAQSRGDRDSHVRLLAPNIVKSGRSQFELELAGSVERLGYDYGSVMHYVLTAFSKAGLPVFETIPPGIPLRSDLGPSTTDAAAIRAAYGAPDSMVTVTTHPPGLRLLVDGEETTDRRFSWSAGERHRIGVPEGFQTIAGRPTARYQWARWSDGGERDHEIEVTEAGRVYTASFVQQLQVRTSTSGGPGSVKIEPESPDGWYTLGTVIRVFPVPGEGMRFVRWFVQQGGTFAQGIFGRGLSQNPAEFPVARENLTYVARFAGTPLGTITSTPAGRTILVDGATCITPCSYEWPPGSTHTIEARDPQTGNEGDRFLFTRWTHGGERSQQVTATAESVTLTAEFRRQFRVVTNVRTRVSANAATRPDQSSILVAPDAPGRFYDTGELVQFSAAEGDGWAFGNWTGDLRGAERSHSLTVREETLVTGTFITNPFITVTSVVHDATLQPAGVSPRQLLRVFCPGLGPAEQINAERDAEGRYPRELAGWRVEFDEEPAEIVSIGPREIRLITPASVAGKREVVVALLALARRGTLALSAYERNPGVYRITNEDGSPNSEQTPAGRGQTVNLVVTGLGALTGERLPLSAPEVRIGGLPAEMVALVAVEEEPEGVFLVTVKMPDAAGSGAQPLELAGAPATAPEARVWVR